MSPCRTPHRSRRFAGYAALLAIPLFGSVDCAVYEDSLREHPQGGASATNGASGGDAGSEVSSGGTMTGVASAGGASDESGAGGAVPPANGDSGDGGAETAGGGLAQSGGSSGSSGAGAGGAGGGGAQGGTSGLAGAGAGGGAGAPPTVKELAHGKPAIASSEQTGNVAPHGNDGMLATRWCASRGTYPQWWRVDLGATHTLSDFVVHFEHPDRKYTYLVETSVNDTVYVQQLSLSGTGAAQPGTFPSNVSARYVRFTVTAGAPDGTQPTWACFFETEINGL
jgi:hypothetical protein